MCNCLLSLLAAKKCDTKLLSADLRRRFRLPTPIHFTMQVYHYGNTDLQVIVTYK